MTQSLNRICACTDIAYKQVWLALGLMAFVQHAVIQAQVITPLAAGLGDAQVASDQIWGAAANPAVGLSKGQRFAIGAYGTTPFDLTGLTRLGLDLATQRPDGTTCFTLSLQHMAPPGFTLSALRLGAARNLSADLQIGLRIGAAFGNYQEYGSETLPIAEGGIRYRVTPTLTAGADYRYAQRELFPLTQRRLQIGIAYASSNRLHLLLAASQAPTLPIGLHVGIDYRPSERLVLALGYQSFGNQLSLAGRFALGSGLRLSTGISVYAQLPMHTHYGVEQMW